MENSNQQSGRQSASGRQSSIGKQSAGNGGRRSQMQSSGRYASSHGGVGEAATELFEEGKKMASDLYRNGVNKVSEVQETIKEYSDDLAERVHTRPLTSLLIAAGVGFILSAFFRK